MRKIKAVIFDLNGVFIQSPLLSTRFEEKFGVPSQDFVLALKEILDKTRRQNAGRSFIYWQPQLKDWNINITEEELFDFWFSAEKENTEMIELAKRIKQSGIKIFILSNNFVERTEYYKKTFKFLMEIFDKVYYSWQTDLVKPDIKAYQKILTDNNLQPAECVYFDDSNKNIIAAESLGIASYKFQGPLATEKIIFNKQFT